MSIKYLANTTKDRTVNYYDLQKSHQLAYDSVKLANQAAHAGDMETAQGHLNDASNHTRSVLTKDPFNIEDAANKQSAAFGTYRDTLSQKLQSEGQQIHPHVDHALRHAQVYHGELGTSSSKNPVAPKDALSTADALFKPKTGGLTMIDHKE
jgi:hypothetical protein